jgi:hypothetical protein
LPTKQEVREQWGESFGVDDVYKELANRLNPAGADGIRSRAWQWKLDLQSQKRTKMDLYDELGKAPGAVLYIPGPSQRKAHEANVRTKQVSGGWRAGKSKWLAAEILPYMFRDNAQIWIIANNYILARYEFEYVVQWLRWLDAPIEQLSTPANGRHFVRLQWGAKLETQTADDITNIEGGNLDCAAVAEAGLVAEDIVRRLRGRVAEKRGPILMAGSLDSSEPWYMNMYQDFLPGPTPELNWQSFGIPSWENIIAFPGGEDDPEIRELRATMTPDQFKLKVCAEVAKPEELVFPEFDKTIHVCNFRYDDLDSNKYKLETPEPIVDEIGSRTTGWVLPTKGPVMLAIDPGYNGAYAVLACRKYDENVFVVDEVYVRRWMVEDVIAECKSRWWWSQITYAVMDIAGKQHDAMSSHLDIWRKPEHLGFKPATNYVPIPDGIQRLRTYLRNPLNGRPRIWFDRKCAGTISEFGMYRFRIPKEDRSEKEEPIDKYNHGIKALEYFLMDRFGPADGRGRTVSEKYIKNYNVVDSYLRERWSPHSWFE